jgi:hypothetical protein
MEMKKFDPVVRQHVMYKEATIKSRFQAQVQHRKNPALPGFLLPRIKIAAADRVRDPRYPQKNKSRTRSAPTGPF